MNTSRMPVPAGLDLFWEEADLEAAAEHPLERELALRLDALARYGAMVEWLTDRDDDDDALDSLIEQQARLRSAIDALRDALARSTSAATPLRLMSPDD